MSRTRPPRTAYNPTLFATGELLPQLAVRAENGHSEHLHGALEGAPCVLVYLPRPATAQGRATARGLAEAKFKVARLQRALLLPANTPGSEVIALADLGLKVFVAQQEGDLPVKIAAPQCVVTDTAGRGLEAMPLAGKQISGLVELVQRALSAPASTNDKSITRSAPVLMIPNVLSAEQCKRLIEHFEHSESHPSGVLDLSGPAPRWRPDPDVKSRLDLRLEDPQLTYEIEQAMAARVLPEIRKCFHYVVSHHEPFKLVRYDEGSGYFRPHRDNESSDTNYRRFAMTLNLNCEAFEGGALQFPEFGATTYRPPTGGAIIFSCSLLHEATDVMRGHRHVLLGFFYNPDDGLTPAAQ